MDKEYTWILWQGKNCRQFKLVTEVRSSSKRGGDEAKGAPF